jgi:hypothetical protein
VLPGSALYHRLASGASRASAVGTKKTRRIHTHEVCIGDSPGRSGLGAGVSGGRGRARAVMLVRMSRFRQSRAICNAKPLHDVDTERCRLTHCGGTQRAECRARSQTRGSSDTPSVRVCRVAMPSWEQKRGDSCGRRGHRPLFFVPYLAQCAKGGLCRAVLEQRHAPTGCGAAVSQADRQCLRPGWPTLCKRSPEPWASAPSSRLAL